MSEGRMHFGTIPHRVWSAWVANPNRSITVFTNKVTGKKYNMKRMKPYSTPKSTSPRKSPKSTARKSPRKKTPMSARFLRMFGMK